MSRLLFGSASHPLGLALAPYFDRVAPLAELAELTGTAAPGPGDEVVLLVTVDDASAFERLATAAAPWLGRASRVLTVMPDLDPSRPLGQAMLRATEPLAGARLRYAPTTESILVAWDGVRQTRALSLPLGDRPIPFVATRDVAAATLALLEAPGRDHRVVGPVALSGPDLAALVERLLDHALTPEVFIAARLRELDADGDGTITTAEAERFLQGLGHGASTASRLIGAADLDGDGTLSLDEFRVGLGDNLATALAAEQRKVAFHQDLPHLARERWTAAGEPRPRAHALAEHLASSYRPDEAALTDHLILGETRPEAVLAPHALGLVDVYILPGRGLLTRHVAPFGDARPTRPGPLWRGDDPILDQPATFSHLATFDGQHLDLRRAGSAFEASWRGMTPTERLHFGEGELERELLLEHGRIVGVACRGRWPGLPDTMTDLMERRPIRDWERALFRELGAIHLDHAEDIVDPQEVICHCVGVKRADLVSAAEHGANTVAAICAKTRATSVCGGCIPVVEELLGSPRLAVAEVLKIERRGSCFATVSLKPVDRPTTPSRAGQHIVVQSRLRERWMTRAYTLTSPGGAEVPYEITVKREELGTFSRFLVDRAGPDSLFRCSEPTGHVYLAHDEPGPVLVFAGGIGVTPGIAIARTLAHESESGLPARRLHIDWSARKDTDFIFGDELTAIASAHPHLTWTRRVTSREPRLDAATVAARYPFVEGALAFICGPDRYAEDMQAMLSAAGWPAERVRTEVFSSKIDDEGNARPTPRRDTTSTTRLPPVQHTSFFLDLREDRPILFEAESFLGQMYQELGVADALAPRMEEVRAEVERTGTWTHTSDELTFGARLAWRNATRCVGRFFWNHLVVRDMRHLETEEDIFAALVDHIRIATHGGDLISTMTVFRPGAPDIRLYNTQLLRYAGYRQPDGRVVGDPANLELTEQAMALGWRGKGTHFDILPLMIRIGDRPARWFEIPEDAILRIPIVHPELSWFGDLGLEWYALPAVSEIGLDLGGVVYRCAPFNGFYMVTEIGARNFSDPNRYNLLPVVAQKMGLDTSTSSTLWKDRAMVELNAAVLHSFNQRGVRILDHHAACDYFLQFERQERNAGREVYGDWSWLVPPMSGSASPLWFRNDLRNVVQKPMYGYQAHAWKADEPPPAHEGPIPPCPHMRGRR